MGDDRGGFDGGGVVSGVVEGVVAGGGGWCGVDHRAVGEDGDDGAVVLAVEGDAAFVDGVVVVAADEGQVVEVGEASSPPELDVVCL